MHEDNAPVTTVRFSPNGRFILAHTLDSCIRLWDYVSGSCKKTYQGHVNKKYSLGGAFGVSGNQGFIVSGSEDGDIMFWDVTNKEVVQRVSGHEGVVSWVDTCPGSKGAIVSGGLDGTVRIWIDVSEDEEDIASVTGLKLEPEDGDDGFMEDIKTEPGVGFDNDTLMNIADGDEQRIPDRMDED